MSSSQGFYGTTIGKKVVMAVTGLIVVAFLVGHMMGNLLVFAEPARLNAYAAFLKATPTLLWGTRLVLLASIVLHIFAAAQLTLLSWKARPKRYVKQRHIETTYAARTMRWSGPILASFIVYHLLHLTVGSVHPNFDEHDVWSNVVNAFSVWYVAAFYIVAVLSLGLHLYHGLWSLLQTVGVNHPRVNNLRRIVAAAVSLAVVAGYASIPLAVLTGLIQKTQ